MPSIKTIATEPNKIKPIKLNKKSDIINYHELLVKHNYFKSSFKTET